jgi:hypothetical protein
MTGSTAPGGKRELETIAAAVADLAATVHLLTGRLCDDDLVAGSGTAADAETQRLQQEVGGRGGEPDDKEAGGDLQELCRLRNEVGQLREALVSRSVIERAKGVIMAQAGCGEDDAFQLLVEASRRERRKLREVASQIATRSQFVVVDLPAGNRAVHGLSRQDPADST